MIIDKVYLLNLDDDLVSKERLLKSDTQLKKLVDVFSQYQRIPAICGKKLSEDYLKFITTPYAYYHLKNGRYFHHQLNKVGAIGCSLSHIKIWKDMIDNKYENVIIFEDDFKINNINLFYEQINNIPANAKICFLHYVDLGFSSEFIKQNKYWSNSNSPFLSSTLCYFLNLELAKELYYHALPLDCHIDLYIKFYCLSNNMKIYYTNHLAIESDGDSIIEHGLNIKPIIIQEIIKPYFSIYILLIIVIISIILLKKSNNK